MKSECSQALVEYVLILLFVVVVVSVVILLIGPMVGNIFSRINLHDVATLPPSYYTNP